MPASRWRRLVADRSALPLCDWTKAEFHTFIRGKGRPEGLSRTDSGSAGPGRVADADSPAGQLTTIPPGTAGSPPVGLIDQVQEPVARSSGAAGRSLNIPS